MIRPLRTIIAALLCAIAVCAKAQTYTITSGGTYDLGTQNYNGNPAIDIETTAAVTIENSVLTNSYPGGVLIGGVIGANVTVHNCYLANTGGSSTSNALITFYRPYGVTVTYCQLQGGGEEGVLLQADDTITTPAVLIVRNNAFNNCYAAIVIQGFQSDPYINISYNQITGDNNTPRDDQISIYNTRGTPSSMVQIDTNFIQGSPDAVQVPLAGLIQAGDGTGNYASAYVAVVGNYLMNGMVYALSLGYQNASANYATNNIVVGVGPSSVWSTGIGSDGYGNFNGNHSGWWDNYYHVMHSYWNSAAQSYSTYPNNYAIAKKNITLSYEREQYADWQAALNSVGVWYGYQPTGHPNPTPTWPQSSDFP